MVRLEQRTSPLRDDTDMRDHHDLEIPLLAKDARNGAPTRPVHMGYLFRFGWRGVRRGQASR